MKKKPAKNLNKLKKELCERPVGPLPYRVVAQASAENRAFFGADVSAAVADILGSLERNFGFKTNGPNFQETPDRVARSYMELFEGVMDNGDGVKEILSKTFPAKAQEMVVVGPIQVWSVCPHHLLPVSLRVWVAYVPKKKVLGLSKLARLAELVAKKPALQEDTTAEIAKLLQQHLKPRGAACYIKGRHLCMEMRGVKKDAVTTTTALEGIFYEPEVRAEFLAAVRGDR